MKFEIEIVQRNHQNVRSYPVFGEVTLNRSKNDAVLSAGILVVVLMLVTYIPGLSLCLIGGGN